AAGLHLLGVERAGAERPQRNRDDQGQGDEGTVVSRTHDSLFEPRQGRRLQRGPWLWRTYGHAQGRAGAKSRQAVVKGGPSARYASSSGMPLLPVPMVAPAIPKNLCMIVT